jgi:hypothetical protein
MYFLSAAILLYAYFSGLCSALPEIAVASNFRKLPSAIDIPVDVNNRIVKECLKEALVDIYGKEIDTVPIAARMFLKDGDVEFEITAEVILPVSEECIVQDFFLKLKKHKCKLVKNEIVLQAVCINKPPSIPITNPTDLPTTDCVERIGKPCPIHLPNTDHSMMYSRLQ